MFPGSSEGRHLTERSAERIVREAAAAAGILKDVSLESHRQNDGPDRLWAQLLQLHFRALPAFARIAPSLGRTLQAFDLAANLQFNKNSSAAKRLNCSL